LPIRHKAASNPSHDVPDIVPITKVDSAMSAAQQGVWAIFAHGNNEPPCNDPGTL